MIHFGKEPSGDLSIRISPDEVGEIFDLLQTAGLLQRWALTSGKSSPPR